MPAASRGRPLAGSALGKMRAHPLEHRCGDGGLVAADLGAPCIIEQQHSMMVIVDLAKVVGDDEIELRTLRERACGGPQAKVIATGSGLEPYQHAAVRLADAGDDLGGAPQFQ